MAQTNSLEARLQAVFQRLFQIAPEELSDGLRRGQHERWDSLGHLELLEALHQELGIEIAPDEALAMETYADVRRIVSALCDSAPR